MRGPQGDKTTEGREEQRKGGKHNGREGSTTRAVCIDPEELELETVS